MDDLNTQFNEIAKKVSDFMEEKEKEIANLKEIIEEKDTEITFCKKTHEEIIEEKDKIITSLEEEMKEKVKFTENDKQKIKVCDMILDMASDKYGEIIKSLRDEVKLLKSGKLVEDEIADAIYGTCDE